MSTHNKEMANCENISDIYKKITCMKGYIKSIPKTLSGIRRNRQQNYKNASDTLVKYKNELLNRHHRITEKEMKSLSSIFSQPKSTRSRSPAPVSRPLSPAPVSTRSISPALVSPASSNNPSRILNEIFRHNGGKHKSRKRRKNTKRCKSRKRF